VRYFPFVAIVEQERLKQALLLNAVNPAVGGVLNPGGQKPATAVNEMLAAVN
jgi:Mg-chelatase subunit ChlI